MADAAEILAATGDGLIAVVKRDCPTCELVGPVLGALQQAGPVAVYSQDVNERYGPGQRPWSELMHFLAAAQPLAQDAPAPPTVSPSVKRLPREAA